VRKGGRENAGFCLAKIPQWKECLGDEKKKEWYSVKQEMVFSKFSPRGRTSEGLKPFPEIPLDRKKSREKTGRQRTKKGYNGSGSGCTEKELPRPWR